MGRLQEAVDAARENGFAAVSANDHFVFSTPWLDGPTALASVIDRTGGMTVATTVTLAVLRGPMALAKTLAALDVLSEGRLIAGLGPGSSERDYEALGIPFEERWKRLEEVIPVLRALLDGKPAPERTAYYRVPPGMKLEPPPRQEHGIPLWIGSWGSEAGLRRVARLADGWLASAYNTTPEGFAEARGRLARELEVHRSRPRAVPERAGHDVDLGRRGSRRRGSRPRRSPRAASEARRRGAEGSTLHRVGRALRRAPVPLRRGRMPARIHLAAGRRAPPDRIDGA